VGREVCSLQIELSETIMIEMHATKYTQTTCDYD